MLSTFLHGDLGLVEPQFLLCSMGTTVYDALAINHVIDMSAIYKRYGHITHSAEKADMKGPQKNFYEIKMHLL
jgi:hypothetical protein